MYWLFQAAIFRRPRKLFLELLCRRMRLMAIFRSKAKLRTAVRSRTRQSSSRKVNVEHPVQAVFDAPVLANGLGQHLGRVSATG
jgi:hypothetical protein